MSGSGAVGSRSAVGSDAARFTPNDRRDIDAGGVGMSVADLSISKRINARRMAHLCRRLRAAACSPLVLVPLKVAHSNQRMAATRRPFNALFYPLLGYASPPALSTHWQALWPGRVLVPYMSLANRSCGFAYILALSPRCKQLPLKNSHLRT